MKLYNYILTLLVAVHHVFGGMLLYTKQEEVKSGQQATSVLQWNFNSTESVAAGVCHQIQCYTVKKGRALNIGQWSKTSVIINDEVNGYYDNRLTGSCSNKTVTLTISESSYEDSGPYYCVFENRTVNVSLLVQGGPTFQSKNFSSTLMLNEGKTESFEVIYCGNPTPKVEWQFLGRSTVSKYERVKSENETRSFCYRYTFTTPQISRDTCKQTLKYKVSGVLSMSSHTAVIVVRYLPEKLKNVQTRLLNGCLVTRWDGPIVGPLSCKISIFYDIRIKSNLSADHYFTSYSSTYSICNTTLDVRSVKEISVRYRNQFGNGSYVSSDFSKTVVVIPAKIMEETGEFKTAFIAVLSILAIIILLGLLACCLVALRRFCTSEKKTTNETGDSPNTAKHSNATKMNTMKKNTISKAAIIHKPRPMSHVISKHVTKSNTFHGMSYMNRHSDGELSAHKAFMPMNTLQRRITDSLNAYGQVHRMPASQIFENNNTQFNRLSGASDSSFNTPEPSRRYGARENLSRMSSLDSIRSEYDRPTNTRPQTMHKAQSNYDLPNSVVGNIKRPQSLYDLPHAVDMSMGRSIHGLREYELPRSSEVIYDRKTSETSDYSTPRNTIFEEDDDHEFSEYDQPRGIESPRDTRESGYESPSIPKKSGFESPCISKVEALYDTPRICRAQREDLVKTYSLNTGEVEFEHYDPHRRRTLGEPENLYDNIKDILKERGKLEERVTPETNIYQELPIRSYNDSLTIKNTNAESIA